LIPASATVTVSASPSVGGGGGGSGGGGPRGGTPPRGPGGAPRVAGARPQQRSAAPPGPPPPHPAGGPAGPADLGGGLDQGGSRLAVVQGIQGSLEYRTDQVEDLYQNYLGRQADSPSLGVDVAFLGTGGQVEQLRASIVGSPEFLQMHGGTPAGF